jgi:hypothetical protein
MEGLAPMSCMYSIVSLGKALEAASRKVNQRAHYRKTPTWRTRQWSIGKIRQLHPLISPQDKCEIITFSRLNNVGLAN